MKIARKIDDYGNVSFTPAGAIDFLLDGGDINGIIVDKSDEVAEFNRNAKIYQLDTTLRDTSQGRDDHHLNWRIPSPYADLDIEDIILSRCSSREEIERAEQELELFRQHHLYDLLRALHYLVETMRANKIIWGVGRGSSVSSYVLFLLGVHKIDSIRYKLDIRDFIKEDE